MKLEPNEFTFTWSAMSALHQYCAIMAYTNGMTVAAADVLCQCIEAADPIIVFSADFTKCRIHEDSAPAVELLINEYLKQI